MRIRRAVHLSEKGAGRRYNGDAVLNEPEVPLFGVVDSTGGPDIGQSVIRRLVQDSGVLRNHGARVSEDECTENRLAIGSFFQNLFAQASDSIRDEATLSSGNEQVASSAIAATIVDRFAYVAHVGDVRGYLLRDGKLRRLTNDDTLAALQLQRDEISVDEFARSPFKHTLTQALGVTRVLDVHTAEIRLQSRDIFLLCSNGLTRELSDTEIFQVLGANLNELERAPGDLLQRAREKGAQDNLSVVIFEVSAAEATKPVRAAIYDVVQSAYFFNRLSPTQWLTVAPYLEEHHVFPEQTLYSHGEQGDSIFILADGAIRLERPEGSARDVLPGQHFGAMCLACPQKRMESARVLAESRLFSFSRRALEHIVTYKPDLGGRIALTLAEVMGHQLTDVHLRMGQVREALAGWAIPSRG